MAGMKLEKLTKTYPDGFTAVDELSLTIDDGDFVVLVGPSGCGKSTTLRMIAGLESINSGSLKIGDREVNKVRPKDRDIAMVFQSYALYPHLTVSDNMGFSLRMSRVPKKERSIRVNEAAKLLGLESILTKKPGQLSGGQRQRVALGRAIVRKPAVFLFDEPLSNLDPDRRVATRAEIRRIQRDLGTTTVYVTHDHEEAMALGDKIVIMKDGIIQQAGTPEEVYENPKNEFVGMFLGSPRMNALPATICLKDGLCRATVKNSLKDIDISLDPSRLPAGVTDGAQVTLGVRPHTISVKPCTKSSETNQSALTGAVIDVEQLGFASDIVVVVGSYDLRVRITGECKLKMHEEVELVLNAEDIHCFYD
ncbi:MAG: ABC transporter ATP-binding protein [Phycisphaerales bacterium]|nr:ABC transporter ATP-binding protein [Phycisphaerales bacterium]